MLKDLYQLSEYFGASDAVQPLSQVVDHYGEETVIQEIENGHIDVSCPFGCKAPCKVCVGLYCWLSEKGKRSINQ